MARRKQRSRPAARKPGTGSKQPHGAASSQAQKHGARQTGSENAAHEKQNSEQDADRLAPGELAKKAAGWVAVTAAAALITWAVTSSLTSATQARVAPITVTVEANQAEITSMANLPMGAVLPAGQDVASPRSCGQLGSLIQAGAAVASPLRMQLVVQDNSNQAVFINNISVRIVSQKKEAGRLVVCVPQGVAQYRAIQVDLDDVPPKVTYTDDGHSIPFGFTLGNSEQEIFNVTASSSRAGYGFYLYLNFVAGGKPQVYKVSDHGHPFEAASGRGDQVWQWDYGSWMDAATRPPVQTTAGSPFPDSRR